MLRILEYSEEKGASGLVTDSVTKAADGVTITSFKASTADEDRHRDIVDQNSWVLKDFRSNPVILHEHYVPVIGRATEVGKRKADDGSPYLALSVQWDESELNPTGQLVAHQHREGFRKAVSVSFLPGKAYYRADLAEDHDAFSSRGFYFTKPALLEVSSVAVPANASALQLAYGREHIEILRHLAQGHNMGASADDVQAIVNEYLEKALPKALSGALLRAIRDDATVRQELSAAVWSAPEPTEDKGADDFSAALDAALTEWKSEE